MAIKITSDRMIDLSKEELDLLGISTISCYVNLGGKSYSDLDDIFPDDIFTHFEKKGELAKTAAKSPELYEEFFEEFTKKGDTVIHFAASSGISAICEHAKIAANKIGNVFVVDTLNLSNGIALLAKYAISLIKAGETDAQKIYELCMEKRAKVQGSFIIETLELLHKGGRCSGLMLFGATLLKIRPIIYMADDGKMKIREKHRGQYRRAMAQYIEATFKKYPNPDLSQLYFLTFTDDEDVKSFLLEEIAKYHKFENIQFNRGGCNCAIHSGRNAIAMFFFNK